MKQCILYDGQLTDGSIEECLDKLVKQVNESHSDLFFRWNGVTLRVTSGDTRESLLAEYVRALNAFALLDMEEHGDIINVKTLSGIIANLIKKLI